MFSQTVSQGGLEVAGKQLGLVLFSNLGMQCPSAWKPTEKAWKERVIQISDKSDLSRATPPAQSAKLNH